MTLIVFILCKLIAQRHLDEAPHAKDEVGKDESTTLNQLIDLESHGSNKEVDQEDIIKFWDGAVYAYQNIDQVKQRIAVIPTCVVRINTITLLGLLANTLIEKLYIQSNWRSRMRA